MLRFKQIDSDIYRGGAPTQEDLNILKHVYGVNRIISLDSKIADKIENLVKQLDMEHVVIPLSGEASLNYLDFLNNNIVELLTTNQPVYIHCRHGSDRTGLATAIYRIQEQGWPIKKALAEAKSLGFGDKIDPETRQLYISYMQKDINDSFDGVGYYGGVDFHPSEFDQHSSDQQSFAPYQPLTPEIRTYLGQPGPTMADVPNVDGNYKKEPEEGEELSGSQGIPIPGQSDSATGQRGFGIIQPTGPYNI